MLGRGLNQVEIRERSGWHSSNVSRIIAGKTPLTPASQRMLARIFACTEAELHQPIGSPIPAPRPDQLDAAPLRNPEFDRRLRALLLLVGVQAVDDLLRYLMAGDYSGLPPPVARRLRAAVEQS